MKFTKLSHNAPEMVKDMRSIMSLFVSFLELASSKDDIVVMIIGEMDISNDG